MSWSRRETLVGLGAAMVAGCAGRRTSDPLRYDDDLIGESLFQPYLDLVDLLLQHARRYPRMEAQDVYKLCHQRAMGPGHLVSEGDALVWLQREAAELGPLPPGVEDVDVELLDPVRGHARVHLRPWLARGRSLEALATAFAETAARWTPAPGQLTVALDVVGVLLEQGELPLGFDKAAWEAFTAPLVEQGLPAVHHSEGYRVSYAPAYRVVLVELVAGG